MCIRDRNLPEYQFDTYEKFSKALNQAMKGYLSKPLIANEEVMTLGLEAATPVSYTHLVASLTWCVD